MDHVLATTGLCNDKVYLEICCCSVAKSWPALCDQMDCKLGQDGHQVSLSFYTISWSLLKLMSIESVMPSNHLILSHPLLLVPSTFPSFRVFSNESACLTMWPKFWSYSISPSSEYSGLISFRIDWFHLLAVQESSLAPQFESISFQHSFFMIQLSRPYMTTGNV